MASMLLGVHVDSLGAISVHLPPPWYLVTSLAGESPFQAEFNYSSPRPQKPWAPFPSVVWTAPPRPLGRPEARLTADDREGTCLTCDVEVGIAGGFAQLVGNDALVDAGMLRSHSWEHQAMHIPVWGGDSDTGPELGGYFRRWAHPTQSWSFTPTCYRVGQMPKKGAHQGRTGKKGRVDRCKERCPLEFPS